MSKKQKQHKAIVPGNSLAVSVQGTTREDLSHALKTFKRKMKSAGVLEKVKDIRTFTKPCVERRDELNAARYIQKIRDMHRD
jgi:ribosomal protein S21